MSEPQWERQVLEKLATAALTEQRRTRQWKLFFRLVWVLLAILLVYGLLRNGDSEGALASTGDHVALLTLSGAISAENHTADRMIAGLQKAYKSSGTRAVVIRANSPGGSPVLSGMVNDEIRRLKGEHPDIPVYVVVEEVCASGCYYIAAAADKIFVDKASIVGSIGVLSDGFGFTGALEKLGVERRLMTAGSHKALADPFSPRKAEDEAIRQALLDDIHRQFIQVVKTGRGARLKDDPTIFTGLYWLGEKSIPLGLADGYGTVDSVARELVKTDNIVDVTPSDDLVDRFTKRFGVMLSAALLSQGDSGPQLK